MAGLTTRDYQAAFDSQTASNLSGVVHEFSTILTRIWEEARKRGTGTQWVNEHPISRLFTEQIYHLAGGNVVASYAKAYAACTLELTEQADLSDV